MSAEHVRTEHRWLPALAPYLPLAVPVPVGHGVPGEGYPWHWTVCRWLPGVLAARTPVADPGRAAASLARFIAALAAPPWTGKPLWMHGDLHPANLLVAGRELSAVLDFGLLGVGDPACDLMVAWTYLPADCRGAFRDALAADDATWCRGRGWAVQSGLRMAAYSADNPVLDDIGRYTLAQVLADFEQTGS